MREKLFMRLRTEFVEEKWGKKRAESDEVLEETKHFC